MTGIPRETGRFWSGIFDDAVLDPQPQVRALAPLALVGPDAEVAPTPGSSKWKSCCFFAVAIMSLMRFNWLTSLAPAS